MGRVKARQDKETRVEDAIARAIRAYKTGQHPTIQRAAESQGIAYSTLHGRLNLGRQSRRKAHELDQSLGTAEEKAVVKRIEEMDRRGFPLRVDMVRHMGVRILQQREKLANAHDVILGKHWITRFLDRHPHLASKFSTQVKKQRIVSSNPKILRGAFEILGPLIRQFNILPQNVYNMDEKGLQMGKSARVKVICVRGRRSPPLQTDGDRELVTAIETIAADGTVLPPMLIYKGKAQYTQWHQHLAEEDKDTIFSCSPKGWTDQVLGVEYLKLLFDPYTKHKYIYLL